MEKRYIFDSMDKTQYYKDYMGGGGVLYSFPGFPVCATKLCRKHVVNLSHAGQKFEYNIVINEEIQRWKAVKHSLWKPCNVIFTIQQTPLKPVWCLRMNY